MPNLYALVVGIDNYPDPVPSLHGCVNDARGFKSVLEKRYNVPPAQIRTLMDDQATHEAIVRGFREHLSQAQAGDIAVFFYAGHGSQEPTGKLFLAIEPDGKNETLVCHDSRTAGGYDLVDKDVATLIHEVAATGARLTVVLDSCHSGSADRALGDDEEIPPGVRRVRDRREPQPESAYLVPPADWIAARRNMDAPSKGKGTGQAQGFVRGTPGAHVLLAACSDSQSANEYPQGNAFHGAFTWCLLQVLQDGQPLGNEEVFTRAQRLLHPLYPLQTPHLVVVGGDNLRASQFLGLTPSPRGDFFMTWCEQGTWRIDGGLMQSLGAKDAVALFPATATPADLADATRALTTATLLAAGPSESTLAVAGASKLDPQQQYKAVVTARASRIQLLLDGDAAALTALRAALAHSSYVQEGTSQRFLVHAAADSYRIEAPDTKRPVPGPFDASPQGVAATVDALEHMAQWTLRVELSNPSSTIPIEAVDLAVSYYDIKGKFHGHLVPPLDTLNLQYKNDQPPSFRLRVTNRGSVPLYFALLACNADWGIDTDLLAEECVMLDSTQEFFPGGDDGIPTELKPGEAEAHDHIVLLLSTAWFDVSPFALPDLTGPGTRGFGHKLSPAPTPAGDFATRHFEIVTRR